MTTGGDPFRPVRAGEPLVIGATAWNAAMLAGKAELRRRAALAASTLDPRLEPDLVLVRNDTGDDLDGFSVVGLGDPVTKAAARLAQFKGRGAIAGAVPTLASRGRFAVLQEPIRDGAVGLALVSGVTVGRVFVSTLTEVDGDHADVADGETGFLAACGSGAARILWMEPLADREEGFEDKPWCILLLGRGGDPGAMFAVLVTIDGGDAGSEEANCSWTYTVTDLRGRLLGLAKSPYKRRLPQTPYTETPTDTVGQAFYDVLGVLQLYDANETPQVEEPCDPEAIDGGFVGDDEDYEKSIDGGAPDTAFPSLDGIDGGAP